jgi:DNA repair exonuclease SbcCD nuclease subunit
MRITLISDTHTKHEELMWDKTDLPGGDLLIHAGDLMNSGYNSNDITSFCKWFNELEQYDHKVFIAGNHDRKFEDKPEQAMEIVNSYKWIDYLQDSFIEVGENEIDFTFTIIFCLGIVIPTSFVQTLQAFNA